MKFDAAIGRVVFVIPLHNSFGATGRLSREKSEEGLQNFLILPGGLSSHLFRLERAEKLAGV